MFRFQAAGRTGGPICAALGLALLTGCADLKAVRDFAGESARFSACTELTERFRDTARREQPYLAGEALALAQANDQRRQAAYRDLQEVPRALSAYLRTLARLAGDGAFDVAEGFAPAASEIQAHPEFGLGAEHAAACAALGRVAARWASSARQERAVRKMLEEGDPSVQVLLDGMASLVRCYRQTLESERKTVLGLLEVELPYADAPRDRLLAALAQAHLQAKRREYDLEAERCAAAMEGIRSLRTGHRQLLENARRLSCAEVAAALDRCTRDLRAIRKQLRVLDREGA